MAAAHPDVPVVKVDVDENMALAAAFQIESIPTLLVFRDGQPVHKSVGFISRAEIEQLINWKAPASGRGFLQAVEKPPAFSTA